jgi:hypothetical protein
VIAFTNPSPFSPDSGSIDGSAEKISSSFFTKLIGKGWQLMAWNSPSLF